VTVDTSPPRVRRLVAKRGRSGADKQLRLLPTENNHVLLFPQTSQPALRAADLRKAQLRSLAAEQGDGAECARGDLFLEFSTP
jgi:hypothetical protein